MENLRKLKHEYLLKIKIIIPSSFWLNKSLLCNNGIQRTIGMSGCPSRTHLLSYCEWERKEEKADGNDVVVLMVMIFYSFIFWLFLNNARSQLVWLAPLGELILLFFFLFFFSGLSLTTRRERFFERKTVKWWMCLWCVVLQKWFTNFSIFTYSSFPRISLNVNHYLDTVIMICDMHAP